MESPQKETSAGDNVRPSSKHRKAFRADADPFHKAPTSTDMPPPKEPRRNRTSRRKSSQALPLPLDSTDSDATHESVSSWRPSLGVHSYKWEQQRGRDPAFESSGRQGRSREREYERSLSASKRAGSAARLSTSAAKLQQGTDSEDSVKPVQELRRVRSVRHRFSDREHSVSKQPEQEQQRREEKKFSDREQSVSKKPEQEKQEEQQRREERKFSDREHSVSRKPELEKETVREEHQRREERRFSDREHSVSKKQEPDDKQVVREGQPRREEKRPKEKREASSRDALKTESMGASNGSVKKHEEVAVGEEQQGRKEKPSGKRPKEKRGTSSRDGLRTESMGASNGSLKTKKKQEDVAASDSFSFMKEDSPEAEEVSFPGIPTDSQQPEVTKPIKATTAPPADKKIGQLNRWDSSEAQIRQLQDASSEETGWPKKSGARKSSGKAKKFEWAAELEAATKAAAESEARPPFKKVEFNSATKPQVQTVAAENVVEPKQKSKKKKHRSQKENREQDNAGERRSRSPFKAFFGQSAKTTEGEAAREEKPRSKSPFNFLKFGRSSKTERPTSKSPLKKEERARSKSPFSMRWFRKDVETKGEETRARSKSPFFGRKKEQKSQAPEPKEAPTRKEFKPSLPALEESKPEATKERKRARSKSPLFGKKEKDSPIMEDQNHVTAVQLLFVKGHLPGGDLAILNPGTKTRAKSTSPFKRPKEEATKEQEKGRAKSPFRMFSSKQKACDAQYRPTKERSEWTEGLMQQSDEEGDVTSAPKAAKCQQLTSAPVTQPERPVSENVATEEPRPKESETSGGEDGQENGLEALREEEKVPEPVIDPQMTTEEDASKSPLKLSEESEHSVSPPEQPHVLSESAADVTPDVSTSVFLSDTAQKEVARRLAAVTGGSKGLGFWENRVQDFNRRRSLKLPRGKSAVPEVGRCYGPEAPLEQDMPDFPADEPLPSIPQGPSNSPERAEPSNGPDQVHVATFDAPVQSPSNSPPLKERANPSDGSETMGQRHVALLEPPLPVAEDPLNSPPSKTAPATGAETEQQVQVAVPDSPPESFFTIEVGKASVEVEKGESWSSKILKAPGKEPEQPTNDPEEAAEDNEAKQEEALGDIEAEQPRRESPKKEVFEAQLESVRATTAPAVSPLKSPERPAPVRYTDPRSAFQELMNGDTFTGGATSEAVDNAAKSPRKKGVLSGVASWLRKKSPTKMRAEAVRDSKEGLAWDGGLDQYLGAREELAAPRAKPQEVAGRISYSDLLGISKTLPKPLQSAAAAPVRHQNEATKSIQELVAAFYSLGSSPDVKEKSALPASDADTHIPTSDAEGLLQIIEGDEESTTPEKKKTSSSEACEMQASLEVCNQGGEKKEDVVNAEAGHVSSPGASEDQNPKPSSKALTSCPPESPGTNETKCVARSPEPLSCEDDDEVMLGEDDVLSEASSELLDDAHKQSGTDSGEEAALSPEVGAYNQEQQIEAEAVSSLVITVQSPVECDNDESLSRESLPGSKSLQIPEEETQEDAVLTEVALDSNSPERKTEEETVQDVELPPPVTAVSPEKQTEEAGAEEEALSEEALVSPVTAYSPDRRTPVHAAGPRLSWSKTSPTESAEDPLKLWRAMAYPDGRASVNFEEALESRRHLGLAAADVALLDRASLKALENLEPLPEEGDVAEREASEETQTDGPPSWAPKEVEKEQVQVILAQKWDEFIKDFDEPAEALAARASPQRPPLAPKTLKTPTEIAVKVPPPLVLDLAEFSEASPLKEVTDESLGEDIHHENEEPLQKAVPEEEGLSEGKSDSCQTPGANKRGFFSAWWKGAKSSPADSPTKKVQETCLAEISKQDNQGVTDALLAAVAELKQWEDGVTASDLSDDSLVGKGQVVAEENAAELEEAIAPVCAEKETESEEIEELEKCGGDSLSIADAVALYSDGKSSPSNIEQEAESPFDEAVSPVKEAGSVLASNNDEGGELMGKNGNAGFETENQGASSSNAQTAHAESSDETTKEVTSEDEQAMPTTEHGKRKADNAPILAIDVAIAVADTEHTAEVKQVKPETALEQESQVWSADGLSLNRNLSPRRELQRGNFTEEEAQWGTKIPDGKDDLASERRPSLEPLDANRATERTSLPGNGRPSQLEDGFHDENAQEGFVDRGLEKSNSEEVSEDSRTILAARPPTRRSPSRGPGEYARSASLPEMRVKAANEAGLQEELAELRAHRERLEAEKSAIEKRWKASRKEVKNVRKYTDGLEKEVDLMTALLKATEEAAHAKVPVRNASAETDTVKLTDAACDPLLCPTSDKATSTPAVVLVEKAVSPEPGPVLCDALVGADHVALSEAGISTEQGLFTQDASVGTEKLALFDKRVGTEIVGQSERVARETAAELSERARASAEKKAPVIDTSKGSSPARADSVTSTTREKSVGTEGLSETGILEHKVHLLRSQIKEARQQRDALQKELERAADEKAKLASKLADSEKVKPPRDAPYEMHELHRSLGKWQARAQRAEQELTRVKQPEAHSSPLKQKSPIARTLFSTGSKSSSSSSREGSPVEKLRGIPEESFDTWQDRALEAEKQAAERKLELWKVVGELESAKEELQKGSEDAVALEAELKGKLRRMHDDAAQMREEIAILRSTLEVQNQTLDPGGFKEEIDSLKGALAKEREAHKREKLEWRETSNRLKTLLAFWPEELSDAPEAKEGSIQSSNGFASPIHVAAAHSIEKAASDVRESSESSSRDFEGFSPGPVESTEQFEMDKETDNPLSPNKPKTADVTQNDADKAVLEETDDFAKGCNVEKDRDVLKETRDSAEEFYVEEGKALPRETRSSAQEYDDEEKKAVARNGGSSLLVRRIGNPNQAHSVIVAEAESGELSPAESVSPMPGSKAKILLGGGVSSPVNQHPLTRTGSWRSPQSPAESERRYGSPQPSPTSTKYGSPGSSPGSDWGTCRDSNDTWRVKSGPLTKTMSEPRSASPGAFARTMDELVVPRRPSPSRGSKELPRWGSRESLEWTNALQRRDKLAGIETEVEELPTSEEKKLPRRRLSKKKAIAASPSK